MPARSSRIASSATAPLLLLCGMLIGLPTSSAAAHDTATADSAAATGEAGDTAEIPAGFTALFDGQSLAGWIGDDPFWRVENGILIGEITPETVIKRNRFLIYQGAVPDDFELIVEFRVSDRGNSGINYRSQSVKGLSYQALRGYQCDIDGRKRYTGSNYEERKRTTLASIGESVRIPNVQGVKERNRWTAGIVEKQIAPAADLRAGIKDHDWNTARIVAQGHVLKHYINDQLISQVIDEDETNRSLTGKLGVQVHTGPPMTIEYRQILIRPLNSATSPDTASSP